MIAGTVVRGRSLGRPYVRIVSGGCAVTYWPAANYGPRFERTAARETAPGSGGWIWHRCP